MAHTTPIVRPRGEGFVLDLPISSGEEVSPLPIGVPAWYDWLEQNRAFRFESLSGSFSARREQRPGGWYWYASRRLQGKLHIAYLGRSREIDAARLTRIARQLTSERTLTSTHELSAPEAASVFNTTAENMLLLAKLSCPRPRADLLPRPHLVTRLEQCRHYTLALLSTPAGFGKTTLLGEWLRQTMLPVAWLSLDEQDNDPIRFWRYILAALGQLRPSLNAAVTPLLRQPGSSTLQVALITLLNELAMLPQELCLVLDDYHLIREPEIHRSLAFLLEHLPAQFHLLLASRSEPPLPLSGLRATNELLELRETNLRFTEQEALAFLHQTTNLSMETMKLLAERTEGWIAGLQLAVFSLRGHADHAQFITSFTGKSRHIIDYLADEVLDHLPADQFVFLSRTSVLSRLSASLCDAVLAQSGSQRMLELLEQSHLFLFPLDDERRWYRYHQLFAEVLLQRLNQREPDLIPLLQRRAAAWYADHDLPGEAMVYALAARDFDYALHLLECVAEATLLSGESGTVQGWLDALPDQLVRAHPYLSCLYAFLLLVRSQFTVVEERLQDAERTIEQSHASEEVAEARRRFGMIAVARSTVAINLGDAAATITYAQRALDLLEKDDLALRGVVLHNLGEAYEERDELERAIQVYRQAIASNCKSGSFFVAVIALGSLARLQARQGLVQEASETCRRALLLARTQPDREDALLPSAGKPMLFLGKLLYEQNDLDGALTHTLKGIELSHIWMHQRHTIEGYLLLARVHRARGELTAAQEALQTAWRLVREDNAGLFASEPVQKDEKLYAQAAEEIELIWKEFALSPDPSLPFLFPSDALGKREIEILRLLASGLSNREIAEQLILTTGTVKWYTHAIYSKLRVRNRTQAIAEARRLHLLS